MESILTEPEGRDLSVNETLNQIGRGVMMSTGMQPKTIVYGRDWFKVKVSGRFWLIIKLNAGDLYDVEVSRVVRVSGLPTYRPIEQEHDIFADQLAEVVLRLGNRA